MKHLSKYICALCLLCTLCAGFTSCETKWDENGDLDGLWQLTEWHDRTTGASKAQKGDIYFSFQLNMMKMQRKSKGNYYLSLFRHKGDSIVLDRTIEYPADTLVSPDTLKLAVPVEHRFHIDHLNKKRLQLSTATDVLQFRKY